MQVINYPHCVLQLPRLVATVGFFDGVHLGHQFLIQHTVAQAKKEGKSSAVITFRGHPQHVLHPERETQLLTTFEEKIELIAKNRVDYCIVIDFTPAFAKHTARYFIQEILSHELNVHTLLVGHDHRFGHNRQEGAKQYKEYAHEVGMQLMIEEEFQPRKIISSTHIRELILHAQIEQATQLLGRYYNFSGIVEKGFQVGRTLGYPTANIAIDSAYKLLPPYGVYAVWVKPSSCKCPLKGMLYIGNRPTLYAQGKKSIEVNIFDFDQDIYNQYIRIDIVEYIRGNQHFSSKEELKNQLSVDKEKAQKILQYGQPAD